MHWTFLVEDEARLRAQPLAIFGSEELLTLYFSAQWEEYNV